MSTVELMSEAQSTIDRMRNRIIVMRSLLGDHDYVHRAEMDLRGALCFMLTFHGDVHVYGDGPLSLVCVNEHFTFGVNWHRFVLTDPVLRSLVEQYGFDPDDFVGTWSVNS